MISCIILLHEEFVPTCEAQITFFVLVSMPINSPSILSGTDSAGLGGPLLSSFSTGDMTRFDVKSSNKSSSQKQSVY